MNTHLFNAFSQLVLDLQASGSVVPGSRAAYHLQVYDRRKLMQWGSETSSWLLQVTSALTLLTRLRCSALAAEIAAVNLAAALEDKTPVRTFLIDGSRVREIDLTRATELLESPSPYVLSRPGANSGVMSRDGVDFAAWIVRPLLMGSGLEADDTNFGAQGTFGRATEQRVLLHGLVDERLKPAAASDSATGRAAAQRRARAAVPAELLAYDKPCFQPKEGGHNEADFATAPTHCLTIQLLSGARAGGGAHTAHSAHALDVIGDLSAMVSDMLNEGIGRPTVRLQVQVGDVPVDELLRQLNPDGYSWEAMAQSLVDHPGADADSLVHIELASALAAPESRTDEEWAELCADACPGSPTVERLVQREVQR